ncbi:hypothetical protein BREVNS_2477 [Brevinematales bacterium NS]|nr:hypothetical protein BREVNS_2477 [Brevinematales bacterium NS]
MKIGIQFHMWNDIWNEKTFSFLHKKVDFLRKRGYSKTEKKE